ncbi:nuclear transport factor 2 family protein [Novosphingobium sp. LASN5T]|jgi:hypothetical protein|uniref:nuclear transport factor 2 family protein n=1 Tax=Novosphingobium sp. LASN5T TaxID=2491021 RepID=UPI000F5F8378|nr:nuclear transport factor 2 family protein [Novosphingobium sp. LASN5T]RQW46198.1 hypothetical protein EH199_02305 [Novosphingobium sp. LASN5T]
MATAPQSTGIDRAISADDRWKLHDLVSEHWARVDRISSGCASEFYEADATMRIGALVRDGQTSISEYFADRRNQEDESGRRTRHAISGLVVSATDADACALRFLAVVHAGTGDLPFSSGPPATIADFTATCRRQCDGRWLITDIHAAVIFVGPGAASHAK